MSSLTALVLAAGLGKRMKSTLPKVLHRAAGWPLLLFPIRAALEAGADAVVCVVSPAVEEAVAAVLASELPGAPVTVAVQAVPRGTGDAVKAGIGGVASERVLILCGDTPLVRADDLRALIDALGDSELCLMSALLDEAHGYGRVLRDELGRVLEVREHKDLRTDAERAVREVNAGVYVARTAALRTALGQINADNAAGEYYLTDAVAVAARGAGAVAIVGHADNLLGVNDRAQLAQAESLLYQRIARGHQIAGVTVRGDARIDAGVTLGPDAVVEAGVTLRGKSRIGAGTTVDVGSVVTDSQVGERVLIKPYSVITESRVDAGAQIGPFAHLRPASEIGPDAHIGNFVETKKTRVHRGAKANHLAYLGDGEIGEGANVGAGTIFCNYDGFQKHLTVIGPGAFIGSDSQIVAPVRIGKDAYVATGTTVTKDVPDEALAIGRTAQENKAGYAPRLKARLAAAAKKKKAGE
ncbi:MAG: bifunctional UDP-N-acetylglucosamine diphosphorylase/glucosamine-1-phosphate N-acetyltransferase GlmU [Polyangiaceae bacterium]|nr:bifunctional UDP-N-acetylglucosamine diphosphorylase/glucosamine-1-phosphate N-acetyltransferase GlmU [Polyangiaceae bacterium]